MASQGKKICVGISGSIAAYRSPDLVKELVARGHEVQPVLTAAAAELVSSRVLETFSGRPILSHRIFDDSHFATDHIALGRWADLFVVYGATANLMARYAHGLTDDFLSLQLVATRVPVLLAPAMNPAMWEHASVQDNLALLQRRGVHFVGPILGKVACGETGVGHIAAIQDIIERAEALLAVASAGTPDQPLPLQGQAVLISAGPMRTAFDPVRYLQNRSSGRMGLELARAARRLGARVRVLLGPVEEEMAVQFTTFEVVRYQGATEYQEKLAQLFPECDAFLSAAAVLDFDLVPALRKMERSSLTGGEMKLQYQAVPDVVAAMASRKRPDQRVIAFAAETGSDQELLERATAKMNKKHVDALLANPVRPGLGPEARDNLIWILRPGQAPEKFGPGPKEQLAEPLLRALFH